MTTLAIPLDCLRWKRWSTWAVLLVAGGVGIALAAAPGAGAGSKETSQRIDRLFSRWDKRDAPGVIVAVAQSGKTVHARGYGVANLEHGVALTADTVSESGSVAKQFTAAAVVLLAVRGQLALEDPIRKHLPEMGSVAESITVRMLLNHTSGLRDIHGLFELMGRPSYSSLHSNDEVARVMARQTGLNFPAGTQYAYSNAGYILAAVIVERVTKTSFNAFCVEQLFKPRGMLQTRWRDDFTAVVPGRATGYEPRAAGGFRIDMPYSNLVGNGGLLTTARDLLTWNASLDGATGEWGEVVRQLQTRSTLKDGTPIPYALGLIVHDYAGEREIWHGGATAGYRTYLGRFPERGLSIAVLSNAADFDAAAEGRRIARTMLNLPAAERVAGISVPEAELAAAVGRYHSDEADDFLEVGMRNGKLAIGAVEMIPTGPRTFTVGTGQTTYVFSEPAADGKLGRAVVTGASGTTMFVRKAMVRPGTAALAEFAGVYRSAELGVANTVVVRGGRLVMERWPGQAVAAEPTFADGFWFGRGWHARFTRDAAGKVTGFDFTNASGRCRRVRFERSATATTAAGD